MKTKFIILLIISFFSLQTFAQTKIVTGTVTEEDGLGIPSFVITVIGKPNPGTITDFDGNYSIEVNENDTLIFNSFNYIEQKIPVAEKLVINITLYLSDRINVIKILPCPCPLEKDKKELAYSITTVEYTKKQKFVFWFRRLKNKIFTKK